jgi:site-specific DNA-methyltransferase (adenine-specific)
MMMDVDLRHGDCLQLMRDLPDASVDMVLCDLPYGTTACAWDSVIPFEPMWREYWRITKRNAVVVLTAAQPFTSALVYSEIKNYRYGWVWVKNRPTMAVHARNRPMPKHEDVLVFSRAKWGHASQLCERRMPYNPQGAAFTGKRKIIKAKGSQPSYNGARPNLVGREYEPMTNMPHSVLEFAKDESHFHPTQKPVALMEYLIRTYTNSGDVVLDNCMGSGTTGVACVNTERRFIGMEMDAGYFEVARDRIEAARMPSAHIEAFASP